MYQSKKQEPGGHIVFATGGDDAMEKLSLTTRLREAVSQEHWVLHWQPIVEIETGKVEAVEALVRWLDPNGGLVAPGEFIPLAEELGLIEAIGDWVIAELARQRAEWAAAGLDLRVGFNLSPRQLWSAHLADKVLAKLRVSGVDPCDVIVEITESTAMADPDRTQKILSDLHAWGFTLALDGPPTSVLVAPPDCGDYEFTADFVSQSGVQASGSAKATIDAGCPTPAFGLAAVSVSPTSVLRGRAITLRFTLPVAASYEVTVRRVGTSRVRQRRRGNAVAGRNR